MTRDRDRKRAVRAIMAELDVSYTAALQVWRERQEADADRPEGADNEDGQSGDTP